MNISAIIEALPGLVGMFNVLITAIVKAYKTANQPAVSDDDMTQVNADMNAAYAALLAEIQSHVDAINAPKQ